MSQYDRPQVTAVLGPTNTGKTHLAVERLCGHSSAIMGFPLRLLAREIYDRVVAIKGGDQVALLTGEERIVPPQARYFLCTVESMPVDLEASFVAVDEAQLGIDPERGHVFTDRLLNARGRDETMILGSDSLRPMISALLPDADIVGRPRFSTLSYAGAAKLARLPRRSAIVAFSAEQVYAIAETIRRFKGGAAIVMGALSPRTRNAQVEMFQAGEVDYLVATDAIGMGLNLDVDHVAFARLTKFDGRGTRRLTVAEMAQIAGRAGRHQRDGSFGYIGSAARPGFRDEEIAGIEDHRFAPIDHLYWRDSDPRMDDLATLIADLEAPPRRPALRAAPLATDLAVLKLLAEDPDVADSVTVPDMVARLWELCGLPDFQKTGPWHHARNVRQLWQFRKQAPATIPEDWYATRLARLDNDHGDVETVAGRIAAVRTWAYIAHRADWLDDPVEMAGRAAEIETRLSDALHRKLTQRFVDRRTSVLLRDVGKNAASLPVSVAADGQVSVDGEAIGILTGFRFSVDATARASDRKLLLAAADRHLAKELRGRAAALGEARSEDMALAYRPGKTAQLIWRGHAVAALAKGRELLKPEIRLDASVAALDKTETSAIAERLRVFVEAEIARLLAPLASADEQAKSADSPAELRAVLAMLVDGGGIVPRSRIEPALRQLGKEGRGPLHKIGLVIGTLDVFLPVLLKPAAAEFRAALLAVQREKPLLPLPAAGVVIMAAGDDEKCRFGAQVAGFRSVGDQLLRIDMVERLARQAHDCRMKPQTAPAATPIAALEVEDTVAEAPQAEVAPPPAPDSVAPGQVPQPAAVAKPFAPSVATKDGAFPVPLDLATSLGLSCENYALLMRDMGFRRIDGETPESAVDGTDTVPRWTWRGLRRPNPRAKPRARAQAKDKPAPRGKPRDKPAAPRRERPKPSAARATANPFADLKDLLGGVPTKR